MNSSTDFFFNNFALIANLVFLNQLNGLLTKQLLGTIVRHEFQRLQGEKRPLLVWQFICKICIY